MSDISKIKLLGETYDIKDIIAREMLENQKIVNVLDYDVDNTGVTGISSIVNSLILNNPLSTIYFPDGDYLVDATIDIPRDYDKGVNLLLSQNARLFTNSNVENMVQVGLTVIDENSLDYKASKNKIIYIRGGIFDCNNITNTCIKYDNNRQDVHIDFVTLTHFTNFGLLCMSEKSGNMFFTNSLVFGNGSENISIGIEDNGLDNYFSNLTIHNVCIGVSILGGGATFESVHVTAMYNRTPTPLEFQRTKAFDVKCRGNYKNFFNNVYFDTMCIGFNVDTPSENFINNGTCGWYYVDEYTDIYGIKINEDNACLFINNFKFDMPNQGLKNWCVYAPVSDIYRSMINFNRLYFNNIKVNDIGGSHREDCDLVYNLAIKDNKNITTVKDWYLPINNVNANDYVPIAFVAKNASGFYKILLNCGNEAQCELDIYYGETVNYNIKTIYSDNTWSVALCNQINVNGRDYAYLCIKRNTAGNATPSVYLTGASGNAIFCANDNMFNATDSKFLNPTVLFETTI